MKIDRKLNLVLEVGDEDGMIFVHHTPIMEAVFAQHHMFIAKTMNVMYAEGLHPLMAMRVAYYTMRDLAKEPRYKTIPETLFNEIWRMTNALVPTKNKGLEMMPFQEVLDRDLLSRSDVLEVQNCLCFFTSASWVHGPKELRAQYELLNESGLQTTSLDITEFKNGLVTSKPAVSTGEKATPSFIPV